MACGVLGDDLLFLREEAGLLHHHFGELVDEGLLGWGRRGGVQHGDDDREAMYVMGRCDGWT